MRPYQRQRKSMAWLSDREEMSWEALLGHSRPLDGQCKGDGIPGLEKNPNSKVTVNIWILYIPGRPLQGKQGHCWCFVQFSGGLQRQTSMWKLHSYQQHFFLLCFLLIWEFKWKSSIGHNKERKNLWYSEKLLETLLFFFRYIAAVRCSFGNKWTQSKVHIVCLKIIRT